MGRERGASRSERLAARSAALDLRRDAVAFRGRREHNWRMADEGSRGGTRVVVIVAIVGLLSTVVASLATGILTIVAANVQFDKQRSAESQDKRREVYANYQNSVTKVCQVVGDVYAFGDPPLRRQKRPRRRLMPLWWR